MVPIQWYVCQKGQIDLVSSHIYLIVKAGQLVVRELYIYEAWHLEEGKWNFLQEGILHTDCLQVLQGYDFFGKGHYLVLAQVQGRDLIKAPKLRRDLCQALASQVKHIVY